MSRHIRFHSSVFVQSQPADIRESVSTPLWSSFTIYCLWDIPEGPHGTTDAVTLSNFCYWPCISDSIVFSMYTVGIDFQGVISLMA